MRDLLILLIVNEKRILFKKWLSCNLRLWRKICKETVSTLRSNGNSLSLEYIRYKQKTWFQAESMKEKPMRNFSNTVCTCDCHFFTHLYKSILHVLGTILWMHDAEVLLFEKREAVSYLAVAFQFQHARI